MKIGTPEKETNENAIDNTEQIKYKTIFVL
jgi:hypothetical protein